MLHPKRFRGAPSESRQHYDPRVQHMARTLEAHDKLLREIFEDSYQFSVPEYQRPYSWTTEQAGELFDDLYAAMLDARSTKSDSQYFLGSIVLIKDNRDPASSVVDGQQRLSTLTMLFAVLRAAMPDAAEDITDFLYKKGKASLGQKNEYRLTAREEDETFFREFIQEPGGIDKLVKHTGKLRDSALLYQENASFLLNKVKALSKEDRLDLWKFLANNCSLVVISTPDMEAAYRIFSVLNNRGLDLAPIDIIKAPVLGAIRSDKGADVSKEYARKWGQIESTLGRDAFGDLFFHIRAIYAKKKQKYSLVREFQDHVTEYKTPTKLIDEVIEPYAEVWAFVRGANFSSNVHAEEINEHLSWLNRIDFKDWVPPALFYFKRYRDQPALLMRFFELLERLAYFHAVTKAGSSERNVTYTGLSEEIEKLDLVGDPNTLSKLKLSDAQKREFVEALDGDIYRRLPKVSTALVLRLESLMRAPGVQLQSGASLEHVLPQHPQAGSEWLRWFPKQQDREQWVHRLANLVLLDRNKNSSASNFNFDKKINIYFKGRGKASPFVLTQDVRTKKKWTKDVLEERQKHLVNTLRKHWDL